MNIQELKTGMLELQDKLYQISKLPKSKCLESFVGFDFDEVFIYYNTKQYYSGCGDDDYTLTIAWDEIGKDLDYFVKRFEAQEELDFAEKIKREERDRKLKEESEKKLLEKLQLKYGNIPKF